MGQTVEEEVDVMLDGAVDFPDLSPAVQLRRALVQYLRDTVPFTTNVQEGQIRGQFDVAGEITQGAGCFVSAVDLGGHNGLPGRILVDVELTATAWTHLNEDGNGLECDVIASAIQAALSDGFNPPLDGWAIRHIQSWTAGEITTQESFRMCEVKTTVFLQNNKG